MQIEASYTVLDRGREEIRATLVLNKVRLLGVGRELESLATYLVWDPNTAMMVSQIVNAGNVNDLRNLKEFFEHAYWASQA